MNKSNYNNLLLKQLRKVPSGYMGYVNTKPIDDAYANAVEGRNLKYKRLGQGRDLNNARIQMARDRLDERRRVRSKRYDLAKDVHSDAQDSMNTANMIQLAGVPISFYKGQNEAKQRQAVTDLLKKQAAYYESLGA